MAWVAPRLIPVMLVWRLACVEVSPEMAAAFPTVIPFAAGYLEEDSTVA
jgi:hypothetical protein